jgi:hypothetical protein
LVELTIASAVLLFILLELKVFQEFLQRTQVKEVPCPGR